MAEPLLRAEHLSKRFGGLLAVDAISLSVDPGRVSALIGPNGAGKTTLFAIVSGFLRPSAGRVFYRGMDVTGVAPHLLARRGLARTFQITQSFAGLTVRENIAIGTHLSRPARSAALAAAAEVASLTGLADVLDRPASSLTTAARKRLEVARAVAIAPELLLLDEVLAGLTPTEVAQMIQMLRTLARRGITIVMIEHVMQAVMSLAQHVFVLAQGRIIAEGAPQAVVANARVVEAYLGPGAAARLAAGRDADG